jgi:hypothetical protein
MEAALSPSVLVQLSENDDHESLIYWLIDDHESSSSISHILTLPTLARLCSLQSEYPRGYIVLPSPIFVPFSPIDVTCILWWFFLMLCATFVHSLFLSLFSLTSQGARVHNRDSCIRHFLCVVRFHFSRHQTFKQAYFWKSILTANNTNRYYLVKKLRPFQDDLWLHLVRFSLE